MKLRSFVITDLREGLFRHAWRYLLVFALSFIFSLIFSHEFLTFQIQNTHTLSTPSFGDYLINLVAGSAIHHLNAEEPFFFPGLWLLLFLLLAYITLSYPSQALKKSGTLLLVEAQSRWVWWLSKCIWLALSVVVFFLVALAGAFVWTLIDGGSFSFKITGITPLVLLFGKITNIPDSWSMGVSFYAGVVVISVVLCLAQMLLSLVIKPLVSYLCVIGFLLLCSFYTLSPLIANFLMAARSSVFFADGMNAQSGLIIGCVLMVALIVGGGVYFKHKDVY